MANSWIEKLNSYNHGIIKQCPNMWSNGGKLKTMLIPEPQKIDALIQSIQFGTVGHLRSFCRR